MILREFEVIDDGALSVLTNAVELGLPSFAHHLPIAHWQRRADGEPIMIGSFE
jgi:hypothetical protein